MSSFPIVDSHVHLYASSHIPRLNWRAYIQSNPSLDRQNSVSEYRSATGSPPVLRGFVFVESDRISSLREVGWEDPLDEVSFLTRIANGLPFVGEGHGPGDRDLVLGIIPWAPVPAGSAKLSTYMALVKERCEGDASIWKRVRGVRYLLQDKEPGVMLQPDFIDGLNWLGERAFTFDLGVDARSGGMHQLHEACAMLERVHDSGQAPRTVINHMCKPNLRLSLPEVLGGHPGYTEWKECIQRLAAFKCTYMKLSGLFSELPPHEGDLPSDIEDLVMHTKPWVDVIFATFGPSRIMFGSDWPVCNVSGPGIEKSWSHYYALITAVLDAQSLTDDEKAQVWSGTATNAYNLSHL